LMEIASTSATTAAPAARANREGKSPFRMAAH
jgi:hypothetical protein